MAAQKKALITGISGQDGSFLASELSVLGYEIFGLTRSNTNYSKKEIRTAIETFQPDEIYHLAAQPYVGKSWILIDETLQGTAMLTANLLEVASKFPHIKIFNASSSEIYADSDQMMDEGFSKIPTNPYGCAKLFSYHMAQAYRENYGMFITNGILFNHESAKRDQDFFSQKLVHGVLDIYSKKSDKIKLGNLDVIRDWGSAEEYMSVIPKLMRLEKPVDINICSGRGVRVLDLVKFTFALVGLNYKNHVEIDGSLVRNKEKKIVIGSSKKISQLLGWTPKISAEEVFKKMLLIEAKNRGISEIS